MSSQLGGKAQGRSRGPGVGRAACAEAPLPGLRCPSQPNHRLGVGAGVEGRASAPGQDLCAWRRREPLGAG